MACLASGMPTTAAVECFGSFADDGATYIAPSNSACRSWVGTTADGVSWRMLLADLGLPDGSMLGWIWDDQTLRWYAFDELTGRLSTGLSPRTVRIWGTPERELSLTRSGADLVGQIRVFRGATRQVALALDPVVGTWTGPAGPLILMPLNLWEPATPTESVAPTQPTTPYLGRWLSSWHPRLDGTWLAVDVAGALPQLTLTMGGVVVQADVSPGTISGTAANPRRHGDTMPGVRPCLT